MDREKANAEYDARIDHLRSLSLVNLEEQLQRNKESIALLDSKIHSDIEDNFHKLSIEEKINQGYYLMEKVKFMVDQQDLNRIITEKQ